MVIAPADQGAGDPADVVPLPSSASGWQTEILTPEEVAHRWPELDVEGVALACFERTSGYADPVATVRALVRSAERRRGWTCARAAR